MPAAVDRCERMNAQRHALVTGAAGFVGQSLAAALHAAQWRVTGLDRVAPGDQSAFDGFVVCDLRDHAALERARVEPSYDAIVHLAALLPVNARDGELLAVNAGGTSAVLDRVASAGTHVVMFSSGLVYGPQPAPFREDMPCLPSDEYGQSKLAAENIAARWGRATRSPVAILRPSVLYGPRAPSGMLLVSLMRALRQGEPFAMTAGEQVRDFVHVDDAVRAAMCVLEQRAEGTWNLASGESIRVREAAELAARIAGSPELLRIGALPYRDTEVFDYRLNASRLRETFAWQPRIELAAGLRQLWEAMS